MPEALERTVYVVGPRWHHHAAHADYAVAASLACQLSAQVKKLNSPIEYRWLSRALVRRLLTQSKGEPNYSLGTLLTEIVVARHMWRRGGSLYHLLYGERDRTLARSLPRLFTRPVIATFHSPPARLAHKGIDRRRLRGLEAVLVVAASQRRYFEEQGVTRVFVTMHGVDTQFFHPAPVPAAGPPRCIVVGGHLRDFETLGHTIRLVRERVRGLRTVILGAPTRWQQSLYSAGGGSVEFRYGISDHQLLAAYQASSLALLPYQDATASNALLESMACGLPVVTSDVGGVPEYTGSDGAILCPPRDPEVMAQAAVRVLDDPAYARERRVRGRTRSLQFDFSVAARQLLDVYATVLGDAGMASG